MILEALVILGVLAVLAGWRGCRRVASSLAGLGLSLLVLIGCGPLTGWMLDGLQQGLPGRYDGWAGRNVIVLLGAGTAAAPDALEPSLFAHGRINRAAMLWHDCHADQSRICRLEISGGDALGNGESEASVYRDVLLRLGVNPADLLVEPNSMNTWQNAQFSAPLLQQQGAERVLLVSSATHLRRAQLYFRHFGTVAVPVRADWLHARWHWLPDGENFMLADVALHEYLGIARYHLYQAMGWNVQATKAGAL